MTVSLAWFNVFTQPSMYPVFFLHNAKNGIIWMLKTNGEEIKKAETETSFLYNVSETEDDNKILEWIESFESRKDSVKHMEYL